MLTIANAYTAVETELSAAPSSEEIEQAAADLARSLPTERMARIRALKGRFADRGRDSELFLPDKHAETNREYGFTDQ
jgi:hypothetical protein